MVVRSNYLHFEIDTTAGDLIRVLLDYAINEQLINLDNYIKHLDRQGFR